MLIDKLTIRDIAREEDVAAQRRFLKPATATLDTSIAWATLAFGAMCLALLVWTWAP